MDVNGTRFHLLIGPRDWIPRLDEATVADEERLEWEARRGQVTLRPQLFRFAPRPAEAPFTPEHRRGAARDRFGHFYWISPDRRAIRFRPHEDSASSIFWSVEMLAGEKEEPLSEPGSFVACAPPPLPQLPLLSGLTVTERHFLIVGTLNPSGLLVFDLHGGGPAVWMRWPDVIPFTPFDLAATPDGGVWVLDRSPDGFSARLWRLDCYLRLVRATDEVEVTPLPAPDAFRPVDPVPAADCVPPGRTFPTGISLALASPPVPAAGDVVSVVTLPDASALVMEVDTLAGDTRLHRWTLARWESGAPPIMDAETLGVPVSLGQALADLLEEPAVIIGHDMAFVPDEAPPVGIVSGTLYVADVAGNQSFSFAIFTGIRGTAEASTIDVRALADYYPMRRWAGRALISGADREAYYDLADMWLPLTKLPRPRYATSGTVDRIVFDGKEPGCVWHRLLLDACIPPGDAIDVESRAADLEQELTLAQFRREPALRLRTDGRELPWTESTHGLPTGSPGAGAWELLFQSAVGRFIEIRLTLRGSGRSSPKLYALRAHYPRFSYLRYLPNAYREDVSSASFLDRFLANFEGFLTELEGRIAAAEVLFDHRTAPPEALDWLAGWLGAALDSGWDDARKRWFLANAAELYRRRGTRRGVLAAVRLALDRCPSSDLFSDDGNERAFGFRLSERFHQGDPDAAHRFSVLAPVDLSASQTDRLRLREAVAAVVERERPSHAAFDVQLYWALFRVGTARVGHDTALGEGSRFAALVLGSSYLGEALLAERHPWDVRDRRVVGRDRTGFAPPLG